MGKTTRVSNRGPSKNSSLKYGVDYHVRSVLRTGNPREEKHLERENKAFNAASSYVNQLFKFFSDRFLNYDENVPYKNSSTFEKKISKKETIPLNSKTIELLKKHHKIYFFPRVSRSPLIEHVNEVLRDPALKEKFIRHARKSLKQLIIQHELSLSKNETLPKSSLHIALLKTDKLVKYFNQHFQRLKSLSEL
ncbi:Uncharacterised protein [uncultured archaeon]|nr:Uncharacterised protein [uncultured archaeon]